jgi:tetratricopeptide (TPR) repeat protein
VDAVYQMTEGNPFFLGEVVRLWEDEGGPPEAGAAGEVPIALPQGVREAIGRRLDALSDDCNRLLRMASVLGRRFRTSVLERVAERPAPLLLGDLDEAVAARIASPVEGSVGVYAFSHLLVKETLYEELTTPERVALHRRTAQVLEELHGGDSPQYLAELAHHLFQAAAGGEAQRAVTACVAAGRYAMRVLAYEEAAAHYERARLALELTGRVDEVECCELLLAEADARDRAAEFEHQRLVASQAFDKARALGRPDLLGRAALAVSGRFDLGPPYAHGRAEIEEALGALGDAHPGLRSRLLGRLAVTSPHRDSMEMRWKLARQALELAKQSDDAEATIAALAAMGYPALLGPDHDDKRLEIADEVEALALRTGRRDMLPRVHEDRMRSYLAAGDVEAAAREVRDSERIAESLRDPAYRYFCSFFHVTRAIAEGRFGEAEQRIRDAHVLGQRLVRHEQSNALAVDGIFLYQVMQLLRGKAELDRMPSGFDAFAAFLDRFTFPGPAIETLQAVSWIGHGETEKAREEFERIARKGLASIPRDEWWLPTLGGLTEIAHALGDAERARELHALLLPFAGRNLVHQLMRFYDGSVSRFLGLLAETFGDLDAAEHHFASALELNERLGARAHLAWTQLDAARVRLARGRPADRRTASDLLERCQLLAERCEMPRLAERAAGLKGRLA